MKPERYINENSPLEWALRKTYLEYLSENNLNEIIPFGIIEVINIFYSVGEHYEYHDGFNNSRSDSQEKVKDPDSTLQMKLQQHRIYSLIPDKNH